MPRCIFVITNVTSQGYAGFSHFLELMDRTKLSDEGQKNVLQRRECQLCTEALRFGKG